MGTLCSRYRCVHGRTFPSRCPSRASRPQTSSPSSLWQQSPQSGQTLTGCRKAVHFYRWLPGINNLRGENGYCGTRSRQANRPASDFCHGPSCARAWKQESGRSSTDYRRHLHSIWLSSRGKMIGTRQQVTIQTTAQVTSATDRFPERTRNTNSSFHSKVSVQADRRRALSASSAVQGAYSGKTLAAATAAVFILSAQAFAQTQSPRLVGTYKTHREACCLTRE